MPSIDDFNVLDSLNDWSDLGLVWNLDACSDLIMNTFEGLLAYGEFQKT